MKSAAIIFKEYEVTCTPKFPTYGLRECIESISATSANDAIKQARKIARENGHTRQDGPIFYSAKRKTV